MTVPKRQARYSDKNQDILLCWKKQMGKYEKNKSHTADHWLSCAFSKMGQKKPTNKTWQSRQDNYLREEKSSLSAATAALALHDGLQSCLLYTKKMIIGQWLASVPWCQTGLCRSLPLLLEDSRSGAFSSAPCTAASEAPAPHKPSGDPKSLQVAFPLLCPC